MYLVASKFLDMVFTIRLPDSLQSKAFAGHPKQQIRQRIQKEVILKTHCDQQKNTSCKVILETLPRKKVILETHCDQQQNNPAK